MVIVHVLLSSASEITVLSHEIIRKYQDQDFAAILPGSNKLIYINNRAYIADRQKMCKSC